MRSEPPTEVKVLFLAMVTLLVTLGALAWIGVL